MLPDSGSVRPVVCIVLVQKVALIPLILETGYFTDLAVVEIILPGRDCLQREHFVALLRPHCNAVHDGMALKVVDGVIFLQIQRNALSYLHRFAGGRQLDQENSNALS